MAKNVKKKEYRGELWVLELDEGGEFKDVKPTYFSGMQKTGDWKQQKTVGFYVKVVGFVDLKAPSRSWGIGPENIK